MDLSPFFARDNRRGSIWDPFSTFPGGIFDAREPFSTVDRTFFGRDFGMAGTRVDWVETHQAHVFKIDIPGMKKEDVKVDVLDGRTLSVSGERSQEQFEEKDSWRYMERSRGKFSRQFELPENANVGELAAKLENEVLTVTVPKSSTVAPRVRNIDIQ